MRNYKNGEITEAGTSSPKYIGVCTTELPKTGYVEDDSGNVAYMMAELTVTGYSGYSGDGSDGSDYDPWGSDPSGSDDYPWNGDDGSTATANRPSVLSERLASDRLNKSQLTHSDLLRLKLLR